MEESCYCSSAEVSAGTWAIQYIPKCNCEKKGNPVQTEKSTFPADAKLHRMWSAKRIVPGLYETEWQITSQIQHIQTPEIHAVKKEMKG